MSEHLLTEEQVKRYLDITDFRSLSKKKIIEFVSAIPEMDREVAIKIIEEFPEFSKYAQVMVTHYITMCNSILENNGNSAQSVMNSYKHIIETLGTLITMDNISSEDRRYFAEKMVEVADKMAAFDSENKNFLAGLTKYITWFLGGCLAIGSVYLGVHIKSSKI